LRIVYEHTNWEIEIWFLENIDIYKDQLHIYQTQINEENRLKILRTKHQRNTLGETKHERSSMEIYNEILHAD
jgi:hypothetical protein